MQHNYKSLATMAKKKILSKQKEVLRRDNLTRGTWKDLKRQAITLGMPFPDACGCSIGALMNYINRSDNPEPNPELINEYDKWRIKRFDETGVPEDDPVRNSRLRLGFISEENENGEVTKKKRVPGISKTKFKKPRERDEFNLLKGTKKSYTFELTKKGYDLERIIRRVQKKFPEANEKSIKLWSRAAQKDMKKNEGKQG